MPLMIYMLNVCHKITLFVNLSLVRNHSDQCWPTPINRFRCVATPRLCHFHIKAHRAYYSCSRYRWNALQDDIIYNFVGIKMAENCDVELGEFSRKPSTATSTSHGLTAVGGVGLPLVNNSVCSTLSGLDEETMTATLVPVYRCASFYLHQHNIIIFEVSNSYMRVSLLDLKQISVL